jgi:hypothetical protein
MRCVAASKAPGKLIGIRKAARDAIAIPAQGNSGRVGTRSVGAAMPPDRIREIVEPLARVLVATVAGPSQCWG